MWQELAQLSNDMTLSKIQENSDLLQMYNKEMIYVRHLLGQFEIKILPMKHSRLNYNQSINNFV